MNASEEISLQNVNHTGKRMASSRPFAGEVSGAFLCVCTIRYHLCLKNMEIVH